MTWVSEPACSNRTCVGWVVCSKSMPSSNRVSSAKVIFLIMAMNDSSCLGQDIVAEAGELADGILIQDVCRRQPYRHFGPPVVLGGSSLLFKIPLDVEPVSLI